MNDASVWYIDSGASSHMTPNVNILKNLRTTEVKNITSANDAKLNVNCVGDTKINNIDVHDVLHVPDLVKNLLSVNKIVEKGNSVLFKKSGCVIKNKTNDIVALCKPKNGTYKLNEAEDICLLTKQNNDAMLWHRRLGHVNQQTLLKMKNEKIEGLTIENDSNMNKIANCEVCMEAKQHRLPFKMSENKSRCVLELIHSDLIGPMETQSIGKSKYILTFVDNFSKKIFCYFLNSKKSSV